VDNGWVECFFYFDVYFGAISIWSEIVNKKCTLLRCEFLFLFNLMLLQNWLLFTAALIVQTLQFIFAFLPQNFNWNTLQRISWFGVQLKQSFIKGGTRWSFLCIMVTVLVRGTPFWMKRFAKLFDSLNWWSAIATDQ
jgi:hypothetical protein